MSDGMPLLPALERLGEEVARVAHAADAAERGRERTRRPAWRRARRGRRRSSLVIALLALLLLAAAAAIAATTGLLTGEPVKDPPGVTFRSDAGVGTVVAGSARLTSLRVADPAGGPPWGVRTLRTTRQMGCLQVGRVVDGRLGVLGQDGAFGNDGRFHELPARALAQAQCAPLDGAGSTFLAISHSGMPASALDYGCVARPLPARLKAPPQPICPAADRRVIFYGSLGPQGRALTYKNDAGRTVRVAADRSGAYLVVRRPSGRRPATSGWFSLPAPGSGFTSVEYRDGSVCRIRSARVAGGARPCPRKGFVAPKVERVTAGQVRAPVRATAAKRLERPGRTPPGQRRPPLQRRVTISFRAPVATPDARSYYIVSLRIGGPNRSLRTCGIGGAFGPVARNVASGELVRQDFWLGPKCAGTVSGTVTLHRVTGKADPLPYAGVPGKRDLQVGTYAAKLP